MNKMLFSIGFFLVLFAGSVEAQHFIGLNKEDTRILARKSGFYEDKMTVSKKFNYLKFVNSPGTKTLIVFFTDEDISSHTRTVCDYSEFDFVLDNYDKTCKKVSKYLWEYETGNEVFEISLEEKEWYFVVRTKKKIKQVFSNG